jgi:hypothetical protein
VKAKHFTQVAELDGLTLARMDDRLEPLKDPFEADGPVCLISDLTHSISRTMTVEAHIRYVELMVGRMLKESGEFEEPVSIITHWKKKRGKNATDIFFTAVPSRIYFQYQDRIRERGNLLLLYPLYGVLHQVLRRTRNTRATAIVFQHGRCADVVMGTAERVFFANRFVAYDNDPAQIAGLWEAIGKEIATVESDRRIDVSQVIPLSWIDSQPVPVFPAEAKLALLPPKTESLSYADQTLPVSLFVATEGQGVGPSISPGSEKVFYLARRWVPRLMAAMLGAIVILTAMGVGYRHKLSRIRSELIIAEQAAIQPAKALLPEISSERLASSLEFLNKLDYSRSAPSFKHVVNDFSAGLAPEIQLQTLKLDYGQNEVNIESYGRISGPFEKAHKDFQRLLDRLSQKGYAIQEKRFDTQISTSSFLIRLNKRIG